MRTPCSGSYLKTQGDEGNPQRLVRRSTKHWGFHGDACVLRIGAMRPIPEACATEHEALGIPWRGLCFEEQADAGSAQPSVCQGTSE